MEIVFDFIIYFYLGVVGVFLIHTFHSRNKTRLSRLSVVLCGALVISWFSMFYGSFIEPRMLIVKQEELVLSSAPTQTLRAVLFSDLHVGPFKKEDWTQKIVDRVMSLQPDVIFIAGDFIVLTSEDAQYLGPLKQLSAPYGVYAVTGNHDYHANAAPKVVQVLENAGINVIEDEVLGLDINGKILRLAGVSDIWFDGDLEKTLKDVKKEDTTLLLAHNPDVLLHKESQKVDAVLAAHTHGGQIRLPWIGPIARIPTQLGQLYDKGWFTIGDVPLFITSGVGESGTRARLFNPPEIIQFDLQF